MPRLHRMMLTRLRRFVLLSLWAFSFGGFLFYASVVIPAGSELLGTTTQGFVTRQVTNGLNTAVALTTIGLTWELVAQWKLRSRLVNWTLLVLTLAIGLCCAILVGLHPRMDAMLNPTELAVDEHDQFYGLHRIYLWVSTLQWLCAQPALWIVFIDGGGREAVVDECRGAR